jgi:putative ABC transport system substrate-binding protein
MGHQVTRKRVVGPIAPARVHFAHTGGNLMVVGQTNRRAFISGLGGAVAWPLVARAQRAEKLATIGFLGASTNSAWGHFVTAFERRLRELGWIEAQTIAIEYRWADGRTERYSDIAAEFVRHKVDIIVTAGSAVLAAKRATSTIPIVFAFAVDPVASGFVANLARPAGNITGLSIQSTDPAGKRLEFLREIIPDLRRVAIMTDVGYAASVLEMNEAEATAVKLGLKVDRLEIRRAEDIVVAVEALKGKVQALYVCTSGLLNANAGHINSLALAGRVPTIHDVRENVEAEGLLSYGPNYPDLCRRAAELVDKILRGKKPGDIPVEQPTKFELVVNLKTAEALGLTVPETLLARADEVIE